MQDSEDKWQWRMNYCKENGIPPSSEWAWQLSEHAFNRKFHEGDNTMCSESEVMKEQDDLFHRIFVGIDQGDYQGGNFLNALDELCCYFMQKRNVSGEDLIDLIRAYENKIERDL